jgi:hypothetical protein
MVNQGLHRCFRQPWEETKEVGANGGHEERLILVTREAGGQKVSQGVSDESRRAFHFGPVIGRQSGQIPLQSLIVRSRLQPRQNGTIPQLMQGGLISHRRRLAGRSNVRNGS